jgi:hypothetical protein
MNDAARAREIMDAIETILREDWDPIGVKAEPQCLHEYWPYVGGVYRLLASRASQAELASHLMSIEAAKMGLAGSASSAVDAARKLTALDVALHRGPAA